MIMKVNTKNMVPYSAVVNKNEILFYAKDDNEAIKTIMKQFTHYRLYRLYYVKNACKKILIRDTEPVTLWKRILKFFRLC